MPGWPAGYPSRGEWAFRNVTQDFMFWPTLDSVSISQLHPDGITTFDATVPDPAGTLVFEDDDEVRISFEGTRIWAGMVRATNKTQLSEHGPRAYELTGQDYTAKLDDSVIGTDTEQPRQSVATRVAWILTHLDYPGMTTTGLDLPDEIIEAASYGGMTVSEALDQVADEMALFWYVDYEGPSGDLHMFREEILAAPFDLDDTAPDYSTSFPYSEFERERDTMELTNAVKVIGKRHTRTVTDEDSITAYGRQESIIVDESLRTAEQVRAAGRRRLLQLAEPIVDGTLVCWEPGLHAGMRVGIVNDLWAIDSNFIITGVDISAVDPHDDDDKALLRSEVRFTDRRRIGRFPGAGKVRKKKKDGTDAAADAAADVGTCCAPVGIGEETLTEATQTIVPVVTTPSAGTVTPPVDYAVGDIVYIFCTWVSPAASPSTDHFLPSNPDTTNSLSITPTGGGRVFGQLRHRVITGVEPADWTVALQGSVTPDDERWLWVVIKDGDIDTANIAGSDFPIGSASSVTVGSTASATPTISFQIAMTFESQVDDEGPPGVAEPSVGVVIGEAQATGGGSDHNIVRSFVAYGSFEDGTMPAVTWTMEEPSRARAFRVSHEVAEDYPYTTSPTSAVTVTVLPVAPWEGGNVGVDESVDPPAVSVDAGDLVLVSSETGKDYVLRFSGPPDMPTELDDFTLTIPFTLDVAGSLSDPDERYLGVIVTIDGQRAGFYARLGDAVRAQGVLLDASPDYFEAKDITEGAQMYLRGRISGGTAYATMWTGADPGMWDFDMSTSALEDATGEEDSFVLDVMLGNDGGAQELRISPLLVSGGALAGEAVDWHIVGYGDGTTVEFFTPYSYDELSLQVRVDNQVLQGAAIADMDGEGAVFTLTRAPYGDPSDETGSSVVEAKYVRV